MTIKDRIAMMRAAAANQGYLKYASGQPPLMLTKTLAKPPESITVFGNSGGVGDKTANLFNGLWRQGHIDTTQSAENQSARIRSEAICAVHAGETYSVSMNDNRFFAYANIYAKNSGNTTADAVGTATGWQQGTFTVTAAGDGYLFLMLRYASGAAEPITPADANINVMVIRGSYTVETMPPFEPYAYKIPIILSDGTASKTITLYSDAGLQSYTAHNLLYGAAWEWGKMLWTDGGLATSGAYKTTNNYIKVEPSTTYYLRYSVYAAFRRPCAYRYDAETGEYVFTRNFSNSSPNELMIKTAANETHIRITAKTDDDKVLLVKSPIALDYFANDMLIYDELAVSAKSRTAERVQRVTANGIISPKTTDVAALQDFVGQDWKIPKADELTVTAGTTVTPGSMEIAYWSSRKN